MTQFTGLVVLSLIGFVVALMIAVTLWNIPVVWIILGLLIWQSILILIHNANQDDSDDLD